MVVLLPILFFSMILPLAVWLIAVPEPWAYLESGVPPGQLMYVLSKLAGLIAIALFTLQLVFALSKHRISIYVDGLSGQSLHYRLGLATYTVILVHVVLFVSAASARADTAMIRLLVPNWQGFYNSMVSLGVLAFYLGLALVLFGLLLRSRWIRKSTAHKLLASICAGLIFVHSIAIGSETHQPVVRFFYAALALVLVISALTRLSSDNRSRGRSA